MRRRMLLRRLVALGGAGALSACLDLEDEEENIPGGDPANRPDRQHAWNDLLDRDEYGNPQLPAHHSFLYISYVGNDRASDRQPLESALTALERAFEASPAGLLFTVGYSPSYFARHDESLSAVDLPEADPIVPGENVAIDDADLFVHLASDRASAVLEAEQALFESRDGAEEGETARDVNPVDDILRIDDRRTGFWGTGLPAERDRHLQGIPEDVVDDEAPSYMNFRAGFRKSQATEDRVTLQEGPFAGGTTMHVATLWLTLRSWFDHSPDDQIARLFSPELSVEDVGEIGEKLTDSNRVETVETGRLADVANAAGVVGHAQKMAHLREKGRPIILRRDVNSDDLGEAGVVFVSLQRDFEDFRRVHLAMVGEDVAGVGGVGQRRNNGILDYIETRRRGNFLVPPREQRALPVGQ